MSLAGKMVSQIEIKSNGDVFHEIFRDRPHHISDMTPVHVQGVELHDGDWGAVGAVQVWRYTVDGKQVYGKVIIDAIDEEKKLVKFKVIEGYLMELYKTFIATVEVDTHGDSNLVTRTFEYEKLNDNIPDPTLLMDVVINVTKDIEAHHLK